MPSSSRPPLSWSSVRKRWAKSYGCVNVVDIVPISPIDDVCAAIAVRTSVGSHMSVMFDAPSWNVPLLNDLSRAMVDASICGLGQAAPNPIASVVKYFKHELQS